MPSVLTLVGETTTPEIPVAKVVDYLGSAADFITGNSVMLLFLAGSIVSMALGMFGKAKRVVR